MNLALLLEKIIQQILLFLVTIPEHFPLKASIKGYIIGQERFQIHIEMYQCWLKLSNCESHTIFEKKTVSVGAIGL